MTTKNQQPMHWQDGVGWGLALWLILSPWILEFASDATAMRTTVGFGFALLVIEVLALTAFRTWEEWINAVIGIALIAAPFVQKFVAKPAVYNAVIVGAVIVLLALTELRQERNDRSRI